MTDTERAALMARLLKAATEATNGWACHARRESELREIARLHTEIASLRAALSTPPAPRDGAQGLEEVLTELDSPPDFSRYGSASGAFMLSHVRKRITDKRTALRAAGEKGRDG